MFGGGPCTVRSNESWVTVTWDPPHREQTHTTENITLAGSKNFIYCKITQHNNYVRDKIQINSFHLESLKLPSLLSIFLLNKIENFTSSGVIMLTTPFLCNEKKFNHKVEKLTTTVGIYVPIQYVLSLIWICS